MDEEQINYAAQSFGEINAKMRDLEEKQRILQDRVFLLGKNIIDFKGDTNKKVIEIKKELELFTYHPTPLKKFTIREKTQLIKVEILLESLIKKLNK